MVKIWASQSSKSKFWVLSSGGEGVIPLEYKNNDWY